jgi:EpsI family protein
MIARRDLAIGLACLVAAGAAYELTPRRRMTLLGDMKLAQIIPASAGGWSARDVGDLVAPNAEGSLVAKLYGEVVERVYQQASTGAEIMMLVAHGDTQSNELQLHRPEVCYPAFGFEISGNRIAQVPLRNGVTLPARQLVADAPEHRENIVYWTRLGEFLPVDGNEQRVDRLRTAMGGFIADGVLARFSMLGSDPDAAFRVVEGFIPLLLEAMPADRRSALIGTRRADAMAARPV